jgi:predicted ribonuclease YlaK
MVERLAGHPEFGYMRLTQSVRSDVARLFGELL